jgi:acetate kinase
LITAHLGNGASMTAVSGGRSIDTSMGLTPLPGLVMGTRTGDVDPAVPMFLADQLGMNLEDIDRLLNKESGLKGLCGDNDMRRVIERQREGDRAAETALAVYAYRFRLYVGAYLAALGGLDALIFTAGVGEHAPEIRRRCCDGLQHLGLAIDPDKNQTPGGGVRDVAADDAPVRVLVVPTDEELKIARETRRILEND